MTTTESTTDIRELFGRAVVTGADVIAGIRREQLDPTPCDEYDVRGLGRHIVEVLRRVAAVGRGDDPFAVAPVGAEVDDHLLDAWLEAAHEGQAAWSDDAALERIVTLPWAQESGADTLAGYANEILVHTWDLATATGQRPQWDDEVVAAASTAIRRILPAEGRPELFAAIRAQMPGGGFGDPFKPVVAVGSDAPLIDQLVAYNGRQP